MATVVIPALLRKLSGGLDRVTVNARNVGEIVQALEQQFPGFREQLLQNDELKPSIAVSIDGEMGTGGLLDHVKDSSEVFFIPAIGGGTSGARGRPSLRGAA
jgi:molybdopterin synthase sulfur carrier subunit